MSEKETTDKDDGIDLLKLFMENAGFKMTVKDKQDTGQIHLGLGDVAISVQGVEGDPRKAIVFYRTPERSEVGSRDIKIDDRCEEIGCLVFYNTKSLDVLTGVIEQVRKLFEEQNDSDTQKNI